MNAYKDRLMKTQLNVLIVEDSEDDALLVVRELRRGGYELKFEIVETAEAMDTALEKQSWDIIISDYNLPGFNALEALNLVKERDLDIPFIIVSGAIGEETAVVTMKAGAHDYFIKGKLTRLVTAVERELREVRVRQEHRRAQEELRDSQERYKELYFESKRAEEIYRSFLHSSVDAIVIYDLGGRTDYISPAFTQIFGWTLEEVEGKRIPFLPESEKEATMALIKDLVENGTPCHEFETKRYTKDGRLLDVSISASRYDDHKGMPAGLLTILRDITEKKLLQAETMRIGHLVSLGELAAGVAHEINNPITGIISIAEILESQCYKQGQDAKIPNMIIEEAERIAEIVKKLLAFARDRKEEHSPAHIKDIISDILGLVERRIIKDGIKLSVNVSSDLPKVIARSQEIQQVFLNIISNAQYALKQRFPETHDDKVFEIRAETTEVEGKEYVRTTFYDRGIGIPSHILDRISDPFFSTKPKDEGTGLGLSISHGIIKNHGGRLWFESVEGEYTSVMIDLPVASRTAPLREDRNNRWHQRF